jgi:hypothetical protein
MNIYFAHSKRIYGTTEEILQLQQIRRLYPKARIINPNFESECCWKWFMKTGMKEMDLIIFSVYRGPRPNHFLFGRDAKPYIGKGVLEEIKRARKLKIPVKRLKGCIVTNRFKIGKIDEHDWVYHCVVG